SRRRHTRFSRDWSSDVCSSDLKDAGPSPDQWVADNAHALATFIRSQREVLGEAEIREILASRSRYSAQDLTVVDWEGAVVIAPRSEERRVGKECRSRGGP